MEIILDFCLVLGPDRVEKSLDLDPVAIGVADKHLVNIEIRIETRLNFDRYSLFFKDAAKPIDIFDFQRQDDFVAASCAVSQTEPHIAVRADLKDSTAPLIKDKLKYE